MTPLEVFHGVQALMIDFMSLENMRAEYWGGWKTIIIHLFLPTFPLLLLIQSIDYHL